VNLASLVALRSALGIFGFAGAELTKVLGSLGSDVCKELHFDATKGFAWERLGDQSRVSWPASSTASSTASSKG
jgi:hypothetical protein